MYYHVANNSYDFPNKKNNHTLLVWINNFISGLYPGVLLWQICHPTYFNNLKAWPHPVWNTLPISTYLIISHWNWDYNWNTLTWFTKTSTSIFQSNINLILWSKEFHDVSRSNFGIKTRPDWELIDYFENLIA